MPAPETAETLRDADLVAPRTEVEKRLAALVAGLLGVPSVSVTDNFFLLGGHSLLGTQLIVRMRDAFGVDLHLRAVFDHPTIEALAGEVEPRAADPTGGRVSATAAPPLSLYRLLDPDVLADPYPLYQRLRTESPVHWDPFLHAWVVTRYADVVTVLHRFSADRTPTPEQLAALGLQTLSADRRR